MAPRRFTLTDSASDKFWEIDLALDGTTVTTRWGRTGTAGQTTTKAFPSSAKAAISVAKQIEAKLTKGYAEAGVPATAAQPAVASGSIDPREHFRYLIDTPGFEPVYEAIFALAGEVTEHADGSFIVSFGEYGTLHGQPPADPADYAGYPASFQALMARHGWLSFPDDGGWCLNLGDSESIEAEYLEHSESAEHAEEIQSPIADYSDWWIYHPTERNNHGEAAICYFSHEGGDIHAPVELNAGALFLSRMADLLELKVEVPDGRTATTGLATVTALPVASDPLCGDHLDRWGGPYPIGLAVTSPDGGHLYLAQHDRLVSFDLSDPLAPRRLAVLELPEEMPDRIDHTVGTEFLSPQDLLLTTPSGWIRIALDDPAQPRITSAFSDDCARAASILTSSGMFFHRYLHGTHLKLSPKTPRSDLPRGDGYGIQPLDRPAGETVLLTKEYSYPRYTFAKHCGRLGERVFFVGQKWLHVFDTATPGPPKLVHQMGYNANGVTLAPAPAHNLVVLFESEDNDAYGVVTIDVERKPKRQSKLLKNHTVHAWTMTGDTGWLVVKDRADAPFLARVDLGRPESTGQIVAPLPLTDGLYNLAWLGVAGDTVTLLWQNGRIQAFRIETG